jgi:redox-sensitive bicupin YhaK (pirin superfamily)
MRTRKATQIVRAQEATEGAGVRIRRSLGTSALDYHDPFLLLDEFKSEEGADYVAGFPDHPHRGFETVTYMLAGSMRHEDHKGNRGELGPGSVQWMTAGRGIIHSEMPLQEKGLMWGFQIWVNLPARSKMTEPRYQDIPASAIPEVQADGGVTIRVIAGSPWNPGSVRDRDLASVSTSVPAGQARHPAEAARSRGGGRGRGERIGESRVPREGEEACSRPDRPMRALLLAT